ncbi:hypothetical protein HID58_080999 [Brassica napus]|uniref:MLO-like protein n=1 Tax=Brassica napus TaxID=3708 RepID=A0ABQ7Y942_BRANA|nr:hypothetical protein HID58_080999 [Brassica napus]
MADPVKDKIVYEKNLEETATWAVAVVCFVLIVISLFIERLIHKMGTWLKKKHKGTLYEALEKVKAELMLLGFISLLLTVAQTPISNICIPKYVASSMRPCSPDIKGGLGLRSKHLSGEDISVPGAIRMLRYGLQFFGSVTEVDYKTLRHGFITAHFCPGSGSEEMPYDFFNYIQRSLETDFKTVVEIRTSFFPLVTIHSSDCKRDNKQNFMEKGGYEITIVDASNERQGESIKLDQPLTSNPNVGGFGQGDAEIVFQDPLRVQGLLFFLGSVVLAQIVLVLKKKQFEKAIHSDLMKVRVQRQSPNAPNNRAVCQAESREIFPLFLQLHLKMTCKPYYDHPSWVVHEFHYQEVYPRLLVPIFLDTLLIPLVVLIVGTKLQVIITKLGLRILEKDNVVRGCPMVQPGDDLFWFDNPSIMLFFIHLVLFTILCSYVTLPLYALVIQMGTRMKPTVFNQRVSKMLKKWHHTAQEETYHGRHSESNTLHHGSSPIHLLHNSNNRSGESFPNPPPSSHSDHHDHRQFYDRESQHQAPESSTHHSTSHESASIELPPIRQANA